MTVASLMDKRILINLIPFLDQDDTQKKKATTQFIHSPTSVRETSLRSVEANSIKVLQGTSRMVQGQWEMIHSSLASKMFPELKS